MIVKALSLSLSRFLAGFWINKLQGSKGPKLKHLPVKALSLSLSRFCLKVKPFHFHFHKTPKGESRRLIIIIEVAASGDLDSHGDCFRGLGVFVHRGRGRLKLANPAFESWARVWALLEPGVEDWEERWDAMALAVVLAKRSVMGKSRLVISRRRT